MERQRVGTGTEWEATVGYSRAVRVGETVHVAGTTATDDHGDPYDASAEAQTRRAIEQVGAALEAVGATLDDVVRTRLYVTDIGDWEAVGRAHGEAFGSVRPAATMVEVSALVDPVLRVEIEADAVVTD
ncbi:RidA family protein [Halomarina ordinaria]|uniref:RidA family protein n=1 Tax=Halomarina ordinaria TaxID=3033939 RepID=A0ABD5UD98_9EURY|nr:RidA family protein [Halomarina sp. PSRA2]